MSLCKSCLQANRTCPVYPMTKRNLCVEYLAKKTVNMVHKEPVHDASASPYKLVNKHFLDVLSENIKALKAMVPVFDTKLQARLSVMEIALTDVINTKDNIDLDETDFPALCRRQVS